MLMILQAQHTSIKFSNIVGLVIDQDSEMPGLEGADQFTLLNATFPKHIKDIFCELFDLQQERNFLGFMDCLVDNVKNLSITLLLLEKKSEKALLTQLKSDLEACQKDSVLAKLSFIQFEVCNQLWLGLESPLEKDHCVGCLLKYLTNTDYVEPGKLLNSLKELVVFRMAISER